MGLFELRGIKHGVLLFGQIRDPKIRIGPVNAGFYMTIGRYPHAATAAGRPFDAIDSQKCIHQGLGYRNNFAIFK